MFLIFYLFKLINDTKLFNDELKAIFLHQTYAMTNHIIINVTLCD